MKKPNNIHDLQYYRLAQRNVARYEELLKDLEKVEEILYNNVGDKYIWRIIQNLTEAKVYYFTELTGWKETLENKGEL